MPLVTLTVRKRKSTAFKSTVLDAVHDALISSGVPPADKFQRVLCSLGRSVKVKRKMLEQLMGTLSKSVFNPENVMVCFKDTAWESWAFGGGRLVHI